MTKTNKDKIENVRKVEKIYYHNVTPLPGTYTSNERVEVTYEPSIAEIANKINEIIDYLNDKTK